VRLLDDGLSRRDRVLATVWWSAIVLGLVVYAAHILLGLFPGAGMADLLDGWVYSFIVVGAAVGILARAVVVRHERLAWALIGLGLLAWSSGEVYWWRTLQDLAEPPFPSFADALYLSFYPLVYAGLILLLKARVTHFHGSQWLDGIASALVIAAAGTAFLLPPVLESGEGSAAAVATNLAYPLGDLLVLAFVAVIAALTGWHPGPSVGLLAIGCAIFAAGDVVFLYIVATGSAIEPGLAEVLWPAGMVVMGIAALQTRKMPPPADLEGWRLMLLPGAIALGALGVLVHNHYAGGGDVALWLAIGALVVGMARAALTFRENIALADSHRQAVTDALTGLPNRRLFHDRVDRAVARARREGLMAAVMIIDLDRFKEVNDTLGHRSGDVLLQAIAGRLTGAVRESDTIARLGGDEFAVLLPEVRDAAAAASVAAVLGAAISEPILLEGLSLDTEASIGIALFPGDGEDVAHLLQRADVAMYTAKSEHLGHAFYGPENDNYSPERLALVGELRRAIENDELVLHYQPKVDLETGVPAGVEVLVRWQHPQRGLLAPVEFVPLAEHTALIKPLTLHILNRALSQCREWELQGRALSVAVNVSARNLLDPDFADAVEACLALAEVPATRLELEITETVLMANPARALEVLERLSDMGVSLSIDDFGTGYSSLDYLKRLPVNVLKIDKSFVMNMANDPADAMIVRSTIDLARNLGLRVVAEGIEDQSAYDMLRSLGCHVGQGFLMSRPVTSGDLEELLDSAAVAAAEPTAPPAGLA
jgi:diguanylate cyclase (GGDEF)-like protein